MQRGMGSEEVSGEAVVGVMIWQPRCASVGSLLGAGGMGREQATASGVILQPAYVTQTSNINNLVTS